MDNPLIPANAHKQRCPRCQSPLNTVVVHGHEQCAVCNQTSLNVVRGIPVRQITTWLLGINGDEVLHPKKPIKNEVIV